jgi:apolipoprotein N-acyltransferase
MRREKRKFLLLAGLGAAIVLQAGHWIVRPPLPADHSARLVQANIPILQGSEWTKEYFDDTLTDLSRISLTAPTPTAEGLNSVSPNSAASGTHAPDLIVWPESPAPFNTTDPFFREAVSNIAREARAWALVGSVGASARQTSETATQSYNSAALVSPGGEWAGRYDKIHLVPFGEYVPFKSIFSFAGGLSKEVGDFSPGESRASLTAGGGRLGVFICYESIFPDDVRQFAANGAQVFVNVSNDGWYGDSGAYAQHLKQARMRAVENNRWLLRDTNTGVTASIDPYGRIVARAPRKIRTSLEAPYALSNVTTFYTRHGDWFAYLCAIISMVALLLRLPFRARTER